MRWEISSIPSELIGKSIIKKKAKKGISLPYKVYRSLDVENGDDVFFMILSDGSIHVMSGEHLKKRNEDYYDEMLPRRSINLD